jgi:hypothetical protein
MFGRNKEAATNLTNNCDKGTDAPASALPLLQELQVNLIESRVRSHIDKAIAVGLARLTAELRSCYDASLKTHGEILRNHREFINKLGDQIQLVLLEDGREIVNVPEHMEIRKVPKGR